MGRKDELKKERDEIVRGLNETYKRLIKEKRKRNNSFVVLRNGTIERVSSDKMDPDRVYKRES